MKTMAMAGALLLAAAGLGGCGGGGGDRFDAAPRIEGLLVGTTTRSSTERDVIAYASEGRLMAIEVASGAFFFDADYAVDAGTLTGTARIYATDVGSTTARFFTETATVSGTAAEDAWQVTITGANSTTTFSLVHDAQDTQDSSLAVVEGTWVYDASGPNTSTLTIASDGTTSSTNDSGCASGGSLAPVDRDFNLYDSATTATDATGSCPNTVEGSYTGLISLFDYLDLGNDMLIVMLAKPEVMLFYAYQRQP
jgi:hypothetical protein